MRRLAPGLSRLPARLPGLVLALWALANQVALGAVVVPSDLAAQQRALAQLATASVLCSAQLPPGHAPAPVPHHHAADSALCPLQAAVATSACLLATAPTVPPPSLARTSRATPFATARAPPAAPHTTALPRGPPAFA